MKSKQKVISKPNRNKMKIKEIKSRIQLSDGKHSMRTVYFCGFSHIDCPLKPLLYLYFIDKNQIMDSKRVCTRRKELRSNLIVISCSNVI
jgi:hypothetical protein